MSDNGQTLSADRPKRLEDVADFIRSFDVAQVGDRAFEAVPFDRAERNVVEGTHILGQAGVASSRLVGQKVVSTYGSFSRAALWDAPLRFEVEVAHQGRTFSTTNVAVIQNGKRMSSVTVLLGADAPDLVRQQAEMPDVPAPEACAPRDQSVSGRDVRIAVGDPSSGEVGPPELHLWLRLQKAPEDAAIRQAMLMELMGGYTLGAAARPHKDVDIRQAHVTLSTGVLALNANLYEDADLSDWLLYTNTAIYTGHGLAQVDGRVFERSGRLVASSTATCMLRRMEVSASAHGGKSRVM